MVRTRSSALVIAALLAAHSVGCGSGGGGGGGSAGTSAATGGTGGSSGSSTTGGSGGSGGTTTSGDTTKPTFTIAFPARAEFVAGAAQQTANGTATDTGSGVDKVEIDGVAATLSGNNWSCPMTFGFGTNMCSIKVTDKAGNVAESNWAFMYSPSYLPANQLVANSAGMRMSANAVNTLVPQVLSSQAGLIIQAIQGLAGQGVPGIATINSVQIGTPTIMVTLAQGGFATVIDVPITNLDATTLLGPLSFSADMRIAGTLNVAVVNGQFNTSMPTPPTITFTNVNPSSVGTLLSALTTFIGPLFQTSLPPVLDTALNSALAFLPYTMTFGQATVTVDAAPRSVVIDAQNARAYGDANFQLALSGSTPMTAPGSVSKSGGTAGAPTLSTPHDLSITMREDLVNRLIYAAWVSGAAYVRFDESMITQLIAQLPLPFPLPSFSIAQLIIPYFPQLAALAPPGGNNQLAFEVGLKMPPVVAVTGAPSLLETSVGEMQVGIQIGNATAGWVDVVKLSVSAVFAMDVSIQNDTLHLAPGQATQVTVDLVQNFGGFTLSQINTFMSTGINFLVTFIQPLIPGIPLTPMIQQLPGPFGSLNNLDIRQDGPGADFLTIEGDL